MVCRLNPGALGEDGGTAAEVNVGGGQVVEAFVISVVIVVVGERVDLRFEVARQVVVFEQDAVLQGLVPALDLALGLRMVGGAAHVRHLPVAEPFGEVAGYVARPIIGQQPGLVPNVGLVAA